MVYTPVISPAWSGKWCLTTPGSATLPTAIPSPMSRVPANSVTSPGRERSPMPAVSTTRDTRMVRPAPNRRTSAGTAGDRMPKHRTGRVVRSPASALDSPERSRTRVSSGPTDAMAGRRLNATRAIPATKSTRRRTEATYAGPPEAGERVVERSGERVSGWSGS